MRDCQGLNVDRVNGALRLLRFRATLRARLRIDSERELRPLRCPLVVLLRDPLAGLLAALVWQLALRSPSAPRCAFLE